MGDIVAALSLSPVAISRIYRSSADGKFACHYVAPDLRLGHGSTSRNAISANWKPLVARAIVSRKAARLLLAYHRAPLDYLRAFGAAKREADKKRRGVSLYRSFVGRRTSR